ncbi:hypothetical protein KGP36_04960 [Patescibacteria group bacterium]|nr:hypothetical protein [Patescibacteria group bacterium]MDE1941116.1 hypothetical protein [Patescibacteria group bacterium]
MSKIKVKLPMATVISAAMFVGAFAFVAPAVASAEVVYDAVPSTLAPSYPSQPFQAQQTSEFGDYVHLGGTARDLQSVTVTMVNWALASTSANEAFCATAGNCDATGYNWPITVNIYSNHLTASDTPDTLLASKTETVHIPWRPVGDPTCSSYGGVYAWRASDNQCYNGIAANVTIDMSDLGVTLPNDVIVGFVYNTQTYGPHPTGVDGPYNSLNIAVPPTDPVTVGSDASTTSVFWNTLTASYYTNPLCKGGTFCEDTNWSPYGTVAMQINALLPVSTLTNMNQCKNGGWQSFDPSFKNQGQCVSYVQANPKAGKQSK